MALSFLRPLGLPPLTTRAYHLTAVLFFGALAVIFYWPSILWLPRGIHEWAQADRLSLAISYYDHGLDFFRPRTLNMSSIDGVVGVEFPLVAYLAALGAKVTGRGSIVFWYRSLSIVTAGLGYYYLFRLVFERTQHFIAALLPGVFLATSPVFAYYAGNFLPDPVSVTLTVTGAYYLLRYERAHPHRFADLVWAIGSFTLATLVKTSAGSYLLAAIGLVLLWTYLQPTVLTLRQRLTFMALCLGSVGLIVAYALFNRHLNEAYASNLFLASTMPIKTPEQYQHVLMRVNEVWWHEYFTEFHYLLLKVSVVICVISLWRIVRTDWLWISFLTVAALGGWAFFWLFGLQLIDHDYYVIAPYWPGLTLLIALATVQMATWSLANRRWNQVWHLGRYMLFVGVLVPLVTLGLPRYRARMQDLYPPFSDYYTYKWMQGGANTLKASHVPQNSMLLVIGEEAPNVSLVYFDRRGITWKPAIPTLTIAAVVEKMETNRLDYLLMRRDIFQQLASLQPSLETVFKPIIKNERYVVLQRAPAASL